MFQHRIPDGVQPTGLARYLSRAWPLAPGRALRDALKKRDVRVNGVKGGADAQVRGGDLLTLYLEEAQLSGPIPVIHRDGRLLCVDKPQGLPVDADSQGIGADTALIRCRRICPEARLVHRLDTDTGGALLLALTDDAERELLLAFREHRIQKKYQAIVRGCPDPREATLRAYLLKDADASSVRVLSRAAPGSREIMTGYTVIAPRLQASDELALLEVRLYTGRTHQIRAHLQSIGHPLLGDDKYGDRALNKRLGVFWPQLWCVELACNGLVLRAQPQFALH